MTTTSRPPDSPTRPAVRPTRLEFVEALQELRTWSGLTLKMLEARHDILKVSTSSDYQRGVRWPRWEWVHAFVTACLTHQRLTDPERIHAELAHWRTAWTHAHHHRTHHDPPPQTPQTDSTQASTPRSNADVQPETGDQEDVKGPIGPHEEHPPAAITVDGNSDLATRDTSAEDSDHAAAAARRLRDRRWWVLGAVAAVVVMTGGAVAVTTTGVFGNPNSAPGGTSGLTTTPSNGAVSPPVQATISPPSNSAAPLPVQTTASPPPLVPQAEPPQQPSTSPTRQVLTPRAASPSRVPPNQDHDANIKDSYNHVNNGVDNRGGTINGGIVAGHDINNSGNTYNR